MSYSTRAMILKNKSKVMEGVKGFPSLKAAKLIKFGDTRKLLITWIEDQPQNISFSAP